MTTKAIKLAKLRRLADNAGTEGERSAALAAVERVKRRQMLSKVANACEAAPVEHRPAGPRSAIHLLPHQRRAWLCLVNGAGMLSKNENSFLHNIRERRTTPTTAQAEWLNLIEVRIQWEKSL